jgi:hypothetical protein
MVHTLEVAPGPRRADVLEPGWLVTCSVCAASVHGIARASTFARARCPRSNHFAVHARREYTVHDLVRVQGGWACLRCRLGVSSSRRANAARSKCPVMEYYLIDGAPCLHTRSQEQCNIAALAAWKIERHTQVEAIVVAPPPIARPALPVWQPHWLLQGGMRSACLRCGRSATARARNSLSSTACLGQASKPAAGLLGPLLGGAFDLALCGKPAAWLELAQSLGWRPISHEPAPAMLIPVQLSGTFSVPPPARHFPVQLSGLFSHPPPPD